MPSLLSAGSFRWIALVVSVVSFSSFAAPAGKPSGPDFGAQRVAARASVRSLTQQLRSRGQGVPPPRRLLEDRARAMRSLMGLDPALAVQEGLPAMERLQWVSEEPAAEGLVERFGVFEGEIRVRVVDAKDLSRSYEERFLHTRGQRFALHFAQTAGRPPPPRSRVSVSGMALGESLAAVSSSELSSESVAEAAACSTTGVQKVAVLLVKFPGGPAPALDAAYYRNVFFGTTGRTVNTFWTEASHNKTSAVGDVFGHITVDRAYTCDESDALMSAAIIALDGQVNFTQYQRIVLVRPAGACSWAGLGQVGCYSHTSPGDGTFQASFAWQVEDAMGGESGVKLSTHELGHNLGLLHGQSRGFSGQVLGAFGESGSILEYGDVFTTMGSWNHGHYAGPHKARLAWLAEGTQLRSVTTGTFVLEPLSKVTTGLQVLRVRRGPFDANLWIEYRQPLGLFDSQLGPGAFGGAMIHYEDWTTGLATQLLDFSPSDQNFGWPLLMPGQSWFDPSSTVVIQVVSATPEGLTLNVQQAPDTVLPTIAFAAPAANAKVRGSVRLEVTATDNYGIARVDYSVNDVLLTSVTSAPFSATWDTVTRPDGVYIVKARAYDFAGNAAEAIRTVTVANTLTVPFGINSGGAEYTDGDVVYIADAYFTGGNPYSTWATISGTTAQALYQNERYVPSGSRSFSYDVPLPAGTYWLTLKLAEIFYGVPDMALLDVAVNGATVVTGLDIFAAAGGSYIAHDVRVPVTQTGSTLRVEFISRKGDVAVKALLVTARDVTPPTAPGGLTGFAPTSNSVTLNWNASTDAVGVTAYLLDVSWMSTFPALETYVLSVGNVLTHTVTDLASNRPYYFRLRALDAAGNVSPDSNIANVVTPSRRWGRGP